MFACRLARHANQLAMRFVQGSHRWHEETAFRTRLRSCIRDGAQDSHVSSFIQVRPVRECHSRERRTSDVLLESALVGLRHSVRALSPHRSGAQKTARTTTQENKMKTPVIISASIQTKSMLNHARRNIAIPSFS